MRVLVDTSVWSLALRKRGPRDDPTVRKLSVLLAGNEDVVLTGLILQEILQAFRSEPTFRKVSRYFEPFTLLDLSRTDYVDAAGLHRKCAGAGVSVSTADCQIAIASIRHECPLLSADKDFRRIAGCSRLELV